MPVSMAALPEIRCVGEKTWPEPLRHPSIAHFPLPRLIDSAARLPLPHLRIVWSKSIYAVYNWKGAYCTQSKQSDFHIRHSNLYPYRRQHQIHQIEIHNRKSRKLCAAKTMPLCPSGLRCYYNRFFAQWKWKILVPPAACVASSLTMHRSNVCFDPTEINSRSPLPLGVNAAANSIAVTFIID